MEGRIDKARAAAVELGQTDAVPWEDVRAVYARPERTPWQSYWKAAKECITVPLGALFGVVAFLGIAFILLLSVAAVVNEISDKPKAPALSASAGTAAGPRLTLSRDAKRAVRVLGPPGLALVIVFGAAMHITNRRKAFASGCLDEGENVVTEALDALPALAAVVSAPVGRKRVEALTEAHAKVSALMASVAASTGTAAGISGYAGDRARLKDHGQKVRTAFANKLGGLVEDREDTTRQLAGMVLTVASRHAQASYGALLDTAALPAEPGPDVPDLRGVRKVLGGASLLALAVFAMALNSGADLVASAGLTLGVFVFAAFLGAVFTGRLHEVGRAFSIFNRNGSTPSGGAP
ncbi:hypothetical protein [Streptomyces sp. NBC_00211]|uniref:hypothetical protein n=1 Tax=Streptomyces sp. NBC_00211 TaxID=2975683 RepID=UPI003252CA4F